MSEYIYATDEHKGHWLTGEEIVRCRDCKHYGLGRRCGWSKRFVTPDGFCAWAERADNFATCKCGEDIEISGRESVTCPSCGRVITE